MQSEVPFTTRSIVKVKLTPAGLQRLTEYTASLINEIKQTQPPGRAAINAAKVTVDFEPNVQGVHTFPMWEFMRIFGGYNMPDRETTDTTLFTDAIIVVND